MKPLLLLSVLALAPGLQAQVTTVAVPGNIIVTQPALDPLLVQSQLSIAPKVVVVTQPTTVTVPATPAVPQEVVKTTKTTTVVDTPGQPRRVYQSERNVVVVQDQNETRELPYVTLPVLFVKETAELLDAESRAALEQVASVIRNVSQTTPGAIFDIEGHTSTDGTNEFNATLSAARAQRVYDELTLRYKVPAEVLSAHGYGESFPMYPNGNEGQMQMDRRVLVVRTK
ncbi:OmpA family protein [Prosthecobacter sp.]|uniref:OmpA family protein n=1 Tax=Prosthecobacter sp. TaxID=1965333 RepID=UPI002487E001|nr:OmpA family protein [Prosthecobacter sp.]MDI1312699.1 OmpA family protein [Prosthecobacter sp.]